MMKWLRQRPALAAVLGVIALACLMVGAMLLKSARDLIARYERK